jgi:hypothetical protein
MNVSSVSISVHERPGVADVDDEADVVGVAADEAELHGSPVAAAARTVSLSSSTASGGSSIPRSALAR